MERHLTDAARLYQAVADHVQVGIFEGLPSGELIFANRAFGAIVGKKLQEIEGKKWLAAVHPDDRSRIEASWEEGLRLGAQFGLEMRFLHSSGQIKWGTIVASPVRNEDGSIAGYLGTLEDLTEFHILEKVSDQFFAISLDLLAVIGFDGYFKHLNPSWESTLGITREEIQSKPFQELVHVDDRQKTLRAFKKLLEEKRVANFENRYRLKDGSYCWLSWNANVSDEDQLIYAIAHNVSRRKKMEGELLRLNAIQKAILDSSAYMMISTDNRGFIQTFNKAAENNLGYKAAEVVGKATMLTFHDPDELAARKQLLRKDLKRPMKGDFEILAANLQQRIIEESEWNYVRKDGSKFPCLLSITPIKSDHEEISGYLAVIKDLTKDKKLELMKKEFISTVSHELRTPLTSIRGSIGLLLGKKKASLSNEAVGLMDIAYRNSERLIHLINDILDLEKMEVGKMEFNFTEENLVSLIEAAVELNEPFARQVNVRLCKNQPCSYLKVKVDKDRLMQVLTNLLSNAIKFSPADGVVTVKTEHSGDKIKVSVIDEGPGIPEEFRSRIFEKFEQADSSDKRQKGGTGLGLAIAKLIMEKLGGNIGFESEVGKGTAFFIELNAFDAPNFPPAASTEVAKNG